MTGRVVTALLLGAALTGCGSESPVATQVANELCFLKDLPAETAAQRAALREGLTTTSRKANGQRMDRGGRTMKVIIASSGLSWALQHAEFEAARPAGLDLAMPTGGPFDLSASVPEAQAKLQRACQ